MVYALLVFVCVCVCVCVCDWNDICITILCVCVIGMIYALLFVCMCVIGKGSVLPSSKSLSTECSGLRNQNWEGERGDSHII
jgi:hypothetical protein